MFDSKIPLIFCLILLLAGCAVPTQAPYPPATESPSATATIVPSPTNSPVPTATSTLRSTPIPTQTPTKLSLTPTPVNTVTNSDHPTGCIALKLSTKADFPASTTLLLEQNVVEYKLWDANTGAIQPVGEASRSGPVILSPNRQYLVVEDCPENGCRFVLRTVSEIVNIFPKGELDALWMWLDNDRILILKKDPPYTIKLLNPFTGENKEIIPEFPNPFTISLIIETLLPVAMDPSLRYAFYYSNEEPQQMVLWDSKSQKALAQLPHKVRQFAGVDLFDAWSPDGKKFIATSPASGPNDRNELFSIDLSGNITQLTHYTDQYSFASIAYMVWSPDGQRIGYWLRTDDSNADPIDLKEQLVIMDMATLEKQVYCPVDGIYYRPYPIVWSPNSDQLVAITFNSSGEVIPVLVDLNHNTISILEEIHGYWVNGWMTP